MITTSRFFNRSIMNHILVSFSYRHSHYLYNTFQSAYHSGHSTEKALLKVANDLFLSLNKGNISVLALPDFSSALGTFDHSILVHHLHLHSISKISDANKMRLSKATVETGISPHDAFVMKMKMRDF